MGTSTIGLRDSSKKDTRRRWHWQEQAPKRAKMKDLVVDVGVLMSASGLGAPEYHDPSFELATKIEACTNLFLAMDGRRRIEYQYQEKMRPGTFGRELLIRLA